MDIFKSKFNFKPEHAFKIGCEREAFVVNQEGIIVPEAKTALEILNDESFGYELSACQIESRVGPIDIESIEQVLSQQQKFILEELYKKNLSVKYTTVAPDSMPLDVYPDPTGRYQRIVQNMPREVLLAACRVAGTHFHIGMPDFETALIVYNYVIKQVEELIQLGNLTQGARLEIYKQMAPNCMPIQYNDLAHMRDYYVENGFDLDPRKCWHFIRISVHGTIEFRMFDNTPSTYQVSCWARQCLKICQQA